MNSAGNAVKTFTKEGSINADFVLNSIQNWATNLTKLTVLVLDNAKIHHAKTFQVARQEWETKGLYIFYLPAYSPHLNRIEILWREAKYRWIKPDDYRNLDTLKVALDNIWNSFGSNYQINFSKN